MSRISEGEAFRPSLAHGWQVLECYRKDLSDHISDTRGQVFYGGGYAYKQSFSYSIPTSSNSIYFLSRGSHDSSSLSFVVAENGGDNFKIDILVEYNDPKLFEQTRICLLTRNKNERGVGFFTPDTPPSVPIRFTVVVKFPRRTDGLLINELDTDLAMWTQSLSLDNLVKFNRIGLLSSNSSITINNTSIKNGDIRTANQPITGSFTSYGRTVLTTANSQIDIALIMKNADKSQATVTELKTCNGFIRAPITLVSKLGDVPATFTVTATTENSPLALSFPSAPTSPFAILNLTGSTSNGQVKTELHPTFEGHVYLETTYPYTPILNEHDVPDPSGQGRVRVIDRKPAGSTLSADVKWGKQSPPGKGKVSLKTINSSNVLDL